MNKIIQNLQLAVKSLAFWDGYLFPSDTFKLDNVVVVVVVVVVIIIITIIIVIIIIMSSFHLRPGLISEVHTIIIPDTVGLVKSD